MRIRTVLVGVVIVAAAGLAAWQMKGWWAPAGAVAQGNGGPPGGGRNVSVEIATAQRKIAPLRVEALGTVTPIASVALKSRLETTITDVQFKDGAFVKEGDLLMVLDSRQIDAQIAQAEGVLARDKAQLEGAVRDFNRYTELIGKGATPQVNLDNARTQADILRATIKADEANLDNLRVQKSYTQIRAPISGRISAAAVKIGNFVRPADVAPIATINQTSPVYVSFAVPQAALPDLRQAMQKNTAEVTATIAGGKGSEHGPVTMIENAVDTASGMVTARATIDNPREQLWPGTLVNASLTLRADEAVVVPAVAVQRSQSGTFVFVVQDGAARVQQVTVDRTQDNTAVIASGLNGGEQVVVDGQLLLSNGTRVTVRETSKPTSKG